jgi:hypothetical protein
MPTLAPPKTPAQEQGANFIETQKAKWATMQGYRAPTAETPAPMPTPAPAPMPTPAPAELAQKYASVKQAIEPKAEMPATPAGEKVVLGAKKPLTATAGRRAVAEAEAGTQETTVYYKTSAGVIREIVNGKIKMKTDPDFAGTRATLYPDGRTVVKGTNTKTGETQTITVDKDGKITVSSDQKKNDIGSQDQVIATLKGEGSWTDDAGNTVTLKKTSTGELRQQTRNKAGQVIDEKYLD